MFNFRLQNNEKKSANYRTTTHSENHQTHIVSSNAFKLIEAPNIYIFIYSNFFCRLYSFLSMCAHTIINMPSTKPEPIIHVAFFRYSPIGSLCLRHEKIKSFRKILIQVLLSGQV